MDTAAIVLAAGAGTRMKSKKPKVAHEILGKPLVRWVVDAAREAGAGRIVSVVGHAREVVEPLVADTEVVVQAAQRGTADAVLTCKDALSDFDGSLLVLSGDCPLITPETVRELSRMRAESGAAVVVLSPHIIPYSTNRELREPPLQSPRQSRILHNRPSFSSPARTSGWGSFALQEGRR